MKIVFRTDASLRIGTGHVMRCLTLAEALRERGAQVTMVCRELEGNLIPYLRGARGLDVKALPAPAPGGLRGRPGEPAHAPWLEVPWETDAAETAAALRSLPSRPDWLVLDHYALDSRWEAAVREAHGRLFVIDDIADRDHDCAYLLDQNLYDTPEARYAARVPASARLLLGPSFALLRPAFAAARAKASPREGAPRRLLVFFGGADPGRDTLKALEALSLPEFRSLAADVVVGAVNPVREKVRLACEARPGTAYHCQADNMAELMAGADLALGAGGTSSWERCCVGLPALLASVAENQRELTSTLARHGAALDLGWGPDLTAAGIAGALRGLLADPGRVTSMSRLCLALVDGRGADRVADRILSAAPADGSMRLRPAEAADMLTYFRWANEAEARRNSYRSDPVPLAGHERWFAARLADPDCRLYVAEKDGEPAGQIRFQRESSDAWISFSVDSRARGAGAGAWLLREGARKLRSEAGWGAARILGAVKRSNPASLKAFTKAGYVVAEEAPVNGEPSIVYFYPEENP